MYYKGWYKNISNKFLTGTHMYGDSDSSSCELWPYNSFKGSQGHPEPLPNT